MIALVLLLAVVLPPYNVTVDASGASWTQPQNGVVCVHIYRADWAGDVRSSCAVEAAGPARREVAIGPGEHVYVEARSPWGGEVGPFSIGVLPRVWLPLVSASARPPTVRAPGP